LKGKTSFLWRKQVCAIRGGEKSRREDAARKKRKALKEEKFHFGTGNIRLSTPCRRIKGGEKRKPYFKGDVVGRKMLGQKGESETLKRRFGALNSKGRIRLPFCPGGDAGDLKEQILIVGVGLEGVQ